MQQTNVAGWQRNCFMFAANAVIFLASSGLRIMIPESPRADFTITAGGVPFKDGSSYRGDVFCFWFFFFLYYAYVQAAFRGGFFRSAWYLLRRIAFTVCRTKCLACKGSVGWIGFDAKSIINRPLSKKKKKLGGCILFLFRTRFGSTKKNR